jgi:MUN domain
VHYLLTVIFFRTLKAFEIWLKKGARGTDYVFPSELLVMMNVIVDFKNHRFNEDEFLDRIQGEMKSSIMERV